MESDNYYSNTPGERFYAGRDMWGYPIYRYKNGTPGSPVAGTSSSTTTSGGSSSGGMTKYDPAVDGKIAGDITDTNIVNQRKVNSARIPNADALENQSSADIASLLNPPNSFDFVDTHAAERAVGSGMPGSQFSEINRVRLNEDERLKRMQIGQGMLTGAYARNPGAPIYNAGNLLITPSQAEAFRLQQEALDLQRTLGLLQRPPGFPGIPGGGAGGGGGGSGSNVGQFITDWLNTYLKGAGGGGAGIAPPGGGGGMPNLNFGGGNDYQGGAPYYGGGSDDFSWMGDPFAY